MSLYLAECYDKALREIERLRAELAKRDEEIERLTTAIKQSCSVTPDGFVLMPTTPTPQMCAVIRNEHDIYGSAEELYAALFDAAPKPGEE